MKKLIFVLAVLLLSACKEEVCDDFNDGDICIEEDSGSSYSYNLTMSTDTFDMYERVIPIPLDGGEWGLLFKDGDSTYKIEAPSKFVNHKLETFLFDIDGDGELLSLYEVFKKDEEVFKDIINANYELPAEKVVRVYTECDIGGIGNECVLEEDGKTYAYYQVAPYKFFPYDYYLRSPFPKYPAYLKDTEYELIEADEERLYLKKINIEKSRLWYKVDGNMYSVSELYTYDKDLFYAFADGYLDYRLFNDSRAIYADVHVEKIPPLESGEEWCFNQLEEPYCVTG